MEKLNPVGAGTVAVLGVIGLILLIIWGNSTQPPKGTVKIDAADMGKCLQDPTYKPDVCREWLQERAEQEKDASERLERRKEIEELTRQEKETRAACPGFLDAPIGIKRCVAADDIEEEIKELKATP